MNSGQQLLKSDQSPCFASNQKGHTRKRERDSQEPTEPQKDGNVQGSRKQPKPVRRKSSGYSCPFAKWDPVRYGGENGCTNYSRSLQTVIRVCSASCFVIPSNVRWHPTLTTSAASRSRQAPEGVPRCWSWERRTIQKGRGARKNVWLE
jgi:hypothetical protein